MRSTVLDERGLPAVRGLSLTVRAGEIVGIAGVEGNGQHELVECLAGLRRGAPATRGSHGVSCTGLRPRASGPRRRAHPERPLGAGWCANTRSPRTWCSAASASRRSAAACRSTARPCARSRTALLARVRRAPAPARGACAPALGRQPAEAHRRARAHARGRPPARGPPDARRRPRRDRVHPPGVVGARRRARGAAGLVRAVRDPGARGPHPRDVRGARRVRDHGRPRPTSARSACT